MVITLHYCYGTGNTSRTAVTLRTAFHEGGSGELGVLVLVLVLCGGGV